MIAKRSVFHRGGDVFDVSEGPSSKSVIWAELIKEKERRFLRNLLREELICFSIRDVFQINIRTVWRPESTSNPGARILHRKGRFAMLLHDTTGRLTTSWTWLKMVQPLYQMGLSVILVDLPGMGKSSINNAVSLDPSVWRAHEGHILCHILDELKVNKCHVVACGVSCSALIRMLHHSPHQLEKEHILHNPVMDYDEIFKGAVQGPAPGAGPNWREQLRAEQQKELETLFVSSEFKILASFDQADQARTRETRESFVAARKHMVLHKNLQVLDVTREDICEAQMGANVPVAFLYPRRELRDVYAHAFQLKTNPGLSPVNSGEGELIFSPVPVQLGPVNRRASPAKDITRLPTAISSRSKSAGVLEGAPRHGNEAGLAATSSSFGRSGDAWYNTAFGGSPEWMDSMNTTGQSSQPAYTSDDCKRESLSRLCGDPRDQRRMLLSALPQRTQHNIKAFGPALGMAITDPEPGTEVEEEQMMKQAKMNSKQTFKWELQARRRGKAKT